MVRDQAMPQEGAQERVESAVGHQILQSVGQAKGLNRWTLAQCRAFIGRRVLEAGCGIGNFTEQLLDRERLICADHDPLYLQLLAAEVAHLAQVRLLHADLACPATYESLRDEKLDTVVCLNVLEHIEADEAVLASYLDVLMPGGHAILLVPAQPWLYSACDRALGHCRRYTTTDLRLKLQRAGFDVVLMKPFNRLGVAGWLVNKLLRRTLLGAGQMRMYERMLAIAKLVEQFRFLPGLSLIVVGRKPVSSPREHHR